MGPFWDGEVDTTLTFRRPFSTAAAERHRSKFQLSCMILPSVQILPRGHLRLLRWVLSNFMPAGVREMESAGREMAGGHEHQREERPRMFALHRAQPGCHRDSAPAAHLRREGERESAGVPVSASDVQDLVPDLTNFYNQCAFGQRVGNNGSILMRPCQVQVHRALAEAQG